MSFILWLISCVLPLRTEPYETLTLNTYSMNVNYRKAHYIKDYTVSIGLRLWRNFTTQVFVKNCKNKQGTWMNSKGNHEVSILELRTLLDNFWPIRSDMAAEILSPLLTPGRLSWTPSPSPVPSSTSAKLPNSVILRLSRNSYQCPVTWELKLQKELRLPAFKRVRITGNLTHERASQYKQWTDYY